MLQVDADRRVEVDAALIPTGRLLDVGDLDLREPRPLPELVLDDCFVVDGSGLRHHATLTSVDLAIEVHSDQPGLQVFTADPIVGIPGRSHTYRGRSAVALETQNFPDAPNQPTFPDSILRPGQTYRATTIWRFRKR
jgi:aldose 1-epimerase